VLSVDLGQPIPMTYAGRLALDPDVYRYSIEPFIESFGKWKNPDGGTELCIILGSKIEDGSIGTIRALTPALRELLTEPDTIVVDKGELSRLGLKNGIGEYGEINGQRVKVVGLVTGYKSLAGPYVFCSVQTARSVMKATLKRDQTIYLLALCRDRSKAQQVVERLRDKYERDIGPDKRKDMSVMTAAEFSWRSQMHWLFKTKAGVAIGYTALLGLLVGAVVTSQTLYAATVSSLRELAILRALGIPRWRMVSAVVSQAFWVGLVGVLLAIPTIYGMAKLADLVGARVMLPEWLMGAVAVVTLATAMLAGLFALRSLRQVEPASLLR